MKRTLFQPVDDFGLCLGGNESSSALDSNHVRFSDSALFEVVIWGAFCVAANGFQSRTEHQRQGVSNFVSMPRWKQQVVPSHPGL
jgi:hypothetical protein